MESSEILARNVAAVRLRQGVSISELARKSGIGKATLIALESGRGNPTLETVGRVCESLKVSVGDMVRDGGALAVDIRRNGKRTVKNIPGMILGPLATFYGVELLYIFDAIVSVGGNVAEPHERGSVEGVYVISGRVVAGPVDKQVILESGDWLRYPSDVKHACRALEGPAKVLMVAWRRKVPNGGIGIYGDGI